MCGIILAPSSYPKEGVRQAMEAMSYRGADGLQGLGEHRGWWLGHVRLAIQTDDHEGAQPSFRSGRLMAWVGELFDHGAETEEEALWAALRSPKLLGLMQLDGFWSCVQIDNSGNVLALVDHIGTKPLYYWPEKGVVCSEIDPMFALEPRPELDELYLSNCIKFGYDWSGRTPWKGILQIPPGCYLRIDSLTLEVGTGVYWDWKKVPQTAATLRGALRSSILSRASHSRHDPVLLLSGGLDSSLIYYVLLQEHPNQVISYSIENEETEWLPKSDNLIMLPQGGLPSLVEAVHHMQAPLDLGSLLPQVQLAKALGEHQIRVCLSGDGADELFGGYSRAQLYDSQLSDVFCELPFYHLPRLDRVMMRQTIELRSPYLSPRVMRLALQLPREERKSKEALKHVALQEGVPERIINRKKHPLKSKAVLEGGIHHRIKLVETFRACHNRS